MSENPIVIVEDDPDIQELIKYNLEKSGFQTLAISDGLEALTTILTLETQPKLILLDLMLPGMSGLKVCRELRKQKKFVQVPIIMVTAKGEEDDIVAGLEMGADDYMVKPFSPKELLARIHACIRRYSQETTLKQDNITIGPLSILSLIHI